VQKTAEFGKDSQKTDKEKQFRDFPEQLKQGLMRPKLAVGSREIVRAAIRL
jgi:hypothetical protein